MRNKETAFALVMLVLSAFLFGVLVGQVGQASVEFEEFEELETFCVAQHHDNSYARGSLEVTDSGQLKIRCLSEQPHQVSSNYLLGDAS